MPSWLCAWLVLPLPLLLLGTTVPACRPKITAPPEPPLAVRLGDDAFRLRDYESAIENYQVHIDSIEHDEYTPFAFYQTALSWYRLGEHERCLDVLDEFERRYPRGHWAQVDALRGDAHYKLNRRAAALIAWDKGWSTARPAERPEFRRRIVSVLREMDEGELAEVADVAENREVLALVAHYQAIESRKETEKHLVERPSAPREDRLASAPMTDKSEAPAGEIHTEAQVTRRSRPETSSTSAVASEAVGVADRAEEVVRLYEEVATTGESVFEAIGDTEEARRQVEQVEESRAAFAPLTRIEIPEPPFVERPVPAPKRIIRVAPRGLPVSGGMAPPPDPMEEETLSSEALHAAAESIAVEPVALVAAPPASSEAIGPKVACVLPLTGADRARGEALLRGIRMVFGAGNPQVIYRDTGGDRELERRLLAEVGGDAEVLIAIAAAGGSDGRMLAKGAERAGLPLLLIAPPGVADSRYVRRVEGESSEEFVHRYREQYGKLPASEAAHAYQAALLAQKALAMGPIPRREVLSRIEGSAGVQQGLGRADAPATGGGAG